MRYGQKRAPLDDNLSTKQLSKSLFLCASTFVTSLHIIFTAIILSVVTYALPSYAGQLSKGDKARLDSLFRQPAVVGTALSFTAVLFLATHYSQQWCRERPSNLYARFGSR